MIHEAENTIKQELISGADQRDQTNTKANMISRQDRPDKLTCRQCSVSRQMISDMRGGMSFVCCV